LKQQDVLPFWVDRFIKVSFRPLTRRDIRRAFDIGSITEDEVLAANIQLGYSDENAQTLTDFAVDSRNERAGNETAVKQWVSEVINRDDAADRLRKKKYSEDVIKETLDDAEHSLDNSTPVKQYARFLITRDSAVRSLVKLGIRIDTVNKWINQLAVTIDGIPALKDYRSGLANRDEVEMMLNSWTDDNFEVQRVLAIADREIELNFNRECIKAVESRFLLGEITDDETLQELRALNITNKFGNEHLRAFQCKRSMSGKMPATQTLCKWFEQGIISEDDYFERLQRVGWDADDSANIFITCATRIGIKRQKAAEKSEKERISEQKRAEREAERLRKQRESRLKGRERSLEKSRKTKDRRDLAIIKAVEKLVKKTGESLPLAFDKVRSVIREVEDRFVLNRDDAIASVRKAIDSPKFPDDGTLELLSVEFAQSFAELDSVSSHGNGQAKFK
jgi:hypothetical protein